MNWKKELQKGVPVIFTPDEEFLKRVEEKRNAKKNRET